MSNLPIDELRQEDDFERNPVGTYWTPPVTVGIHELNPSVRSAMSHAVEGRSESINQFEIHLAHAFDMETCAPVGTFVVSIPEAGRRAYGIYSEAGEVSVKEAMWFAFDGDTDYAFKGLYDRLREAGYLA
jgi:hypothetical protein